MFQLVPQPLLFPAVSLLGLQSPHGFVDTGVDLPIGGRVYLSEVEAGECARLYGFDSPQESARKQALVEEQAARIAELEQTLSRLQADVAQAVA